MVALSVVAKSADLPIWGDVPIGWIIVAGRETNSGDRLHQFAEIVIG